MKLTDRFWHYFFLNPVAWFLLLLLIVAVYANYKLNRQLDTVCDWIKSPDEFIDRPNNAYAKAQTFAGTGTNGQSLLNTVKASATGRATWRYSSRSAAPRRG